jgi:hypothetical protein
MLHVQPSRKLSIEDRATIREVTMHIVFYYATLACIVWSVSNSTRSWIAPDDVTASAFESPGVYPDFMAATIHAPWAEATRP